MTYVEGFLTPVPTANKAAYQKHAQGAVELFKGLGATRFVAFFTFAFTAVIRFVATFFLAVLARAPVDVVVRFAMSNSYFRLNSIGVHAKVRFVQKFFQATECDRARGACSDRAESALLLSRAQRQDILNHWFARSHR